MRRSVFKTVWAPDSKLRRQQRRFIEENYQRFFDKRFLVDFIKEQTI